MNATEIILLILGFLSISISFFLGSKEEAGETPDTSPEGRMRSIWTEKEEQLVKERICSILNDEKDNTLAVTTDLLNRKSNEKIIEFDEFAKPLMEKIRHNHEEVVFMYNMLTEKEKKWKEAAKKRPVKQPVVQPVPQPVEQPVISSPVQQPEPIVQAKPVVQPEPVVQAEPVVPSEPIVQPQAEVKQQPQKQSPVQPEKIPEKEMQKKPLKSEDTQMGKIEAEESKEQDATKKIDEVNKQIVSLHKQGKSVLEISKELNVGQGEVKLTIALYGGNK